MYKTLTLLDKAIAELEKKMKALKAEQKYGDELTALCDQYHALRDVRFNLEEMNGNHK